MALAWDRPGLHQPGPARPVQLADHRALAGQPDPDGQRLLTRGSGAIAMPRRAIELGAHGEVKILAWTQESGKPVIRPPTSRVRAAYWTAETRVRVSEDGGKGLVRVRAPGDNRAEAREALERRVPQILARPVGSRNEAVVKLSPR